MSTLPKLCAPAWSNDTIDEKKLDREDVEKHFPSINIICRSFLSTSHPVPEHFPSSALAKPSGLIEGRTDMSVAGGDYRFLLDCFINELIEDRTNISNVGGRDNK